MRTRAVNTSIGDSLTSRGLCVILASVVALTIMNLTVENLLICNVKGLNDPNKQEDVYYLLRHNKCQLASLIETKYH